MTAVDAAGLGAIPAEWAHPPADMIAKLPKPTKRDNQKGKCSECGGWHGLPAVHLDYLGHADVTLALIAIDPMWTWEPAAIDQDSGGPMVTLQGGRLVMWAKLTVLGKTIIGVGTVEEGKPEPEKELIGDFLRNAAMRFGVGTALWSKSDSADPAGSDRGGGYGSKGGRRDDPRGEPIDPEPEKAPEPDPELVKLWARILAAKGTPLADTLKAAAETHKVKLTEANLAHDPLLRASIEYAIKAFDAPAISSSPVQPGRTYPTHPDPVYGEQDQGDELPYEPEAVH